MCACVCMGGEGPGQGQPPSVCACVWAVRVRDKDSHRTKHASAPPRPHALCHDVRLHHPAGSAIQLVNDSRRPVASGSTTSTACHDVDLVGTNRLARLKPGTRRTASVSSAFALSLLLSLPPWRAAPQEAAAPLAVPIALGQIVIHAKRAVLREAILPTRGAVRVQQRVIARREDAHRRVVEPEASWGRVGRIEASRRRQ